MRKNAARQRGSPIAAARISAVAYLASLCVEPLSGGDRRGVSGKRISLLIRRGSLRQKDSDA